MLGVRFCKSDLPMASKADKKKQHKMNYNIGTNEFKVNNFESAQGYLKKSYAGINIIMEKFIVSHF